MSLTIRLPVRDDQTSFNLRRWEEILADPHFRQLDGKFETDRHGNYIHMPPPGYRHGQLQVLISSLLKELMQKGRVASECPVSTSDGVKGADVVWLTDEQHDQAKAMNCLPFAPSLCVEIMSPRDSWGALNEKKALYFLAGAAEVWICDEDGNMLFFRDPEGEAVEASAVCPDFPKRIEL